MKKPEERKILILYTGGTIGMKPSNGSFGLKPGTLEDLQSDHPDLQDIPYQLDWEEFTIDGELIDSSNATAELYNRLSTEIASKVDAYDGIVVLFGTDTMGPSSAAVSYRLEGLHKPVVFTGSMKPSSEEHSDAQKNLRDAIEVAAQSGNEIPPINEVTVAFYGKLMRAVNTFKYAANNVDAMDDIGFGLLAELDGEHIRVDEEKIAQKDNTSEQTTETHTYDHKEVIPLKLSGFDMFGGEEILKATGHMADAVLFSETWVDTLFDENKQRIIDLVERYAPGRPVFFAGENPLSEEWIPLVSAPEFQQENQKVEFVLNRGNSMDEYRALAGGNVRGEKNDTIIPERELLRPFREGKEGREAFKPRVK